jgi:pimeloyl-ACP methyl ester carboxylesterase
MKKATINGCLALLIALSLTQTGCDLKLPPMPWDKKPAMTDEATQGDNQETEEASEEEKAEPEKLDMTRLIPEAMRKLPYSEVTIPMADGLRLVGRLYDPALTRDEDGETVAPADLDTDYTGPQYPLVILLHGLNLSQAHWQTLPKTLMEAGYAVFVPDLRGHAASTKASRGRTLNWRAIPDDGWSVMYRDVGQVIDYFSHSEDHPEVSAKAVALVGEKLGANVAIWAAKGHDRVKALVLLTPQMTIKGLDAGKGLMDYPNSTMILASQDEQESYATARYLYSWLGGPKVLQIYQKAGEGADMLTAKPGIGLQIRDWLIKQLPPAKIPGAALSDKELEQAEQAGEQAEAAHSAWKAKTPPHKG